MSGHFAKMDKEQLRAICAKGGRNAQAKGTGYRWDHDSAKAAGRKGGRMTRERRAQKFIEDQKGDSTVAILDLIAAAVTLYVLISFWF